MIHRFKSVCPAVFVAALVSASSAAAQSTSDAPAVPLQVMLETDPATFVLSGFSAHLRVASGHLPGLAVGVGVYGLNLPDFVPALHPDNDDGWSLRLDRGLGLFVDYHPAGRPEGLFVGLQAAHQRYTASREGQGGADVVSDTLLMMPRVGFLWHPARNLGLYLMPWLGVGASIELDRDGDARPEYHTLPVLAFATMHVGWAF